MMNFITRYFAAAVLIAAFTVVSDGAAEGKKEHSIADFFGTYAGHKSSVTGEEISNQHLEVTIKGHHKGGFTVDWSTIVPTSHGQAKAKKHSIDFHPVNRRPGLFASAMRKDLFGHMVPLDPLSGEPYVWATLQAKTLTLTALYITDDGGYEIQTSKRTLTNHGMLLRLERIRNGDKLTMLTAELRKIAE